MLKQISTLFIICFAGLSVLGQTEKHTAPVKWERYKVSDKSVSVLFPKLPVRIQDSNGCSERIVDKYAAYAEGIVYGLNIVYKSKKEAWADCAIKVRFDKDSFKAGIQEVKDLLKTQQETKLNLKNLETVKVRAGRFTYWLINDFENDRWFEFWVTTEEETKASVVNFIESIKIQEKQSGIEIGNGSDRTLGDEPMPDNAAQEKSDKVTGGIGDAKESNEMRADKIVTEKFRILLKARPGYTELARKNETTGRVRVRVIFSASGGIGSVTVVEGLPDGLTEQAVAAAKKIVFIPANRNKINYSATAIVEYSFSIY